jgi:hypothetical protein
MPKTAAKKGARKPTKPAKVAAKPSVRDLSPDLKRVKSLIARAKLPGVEEALSYGMPSLKVMGKFLGRVREPDILVVMCTREEKEFLMEVNPAIYFETDHYKGWPAVLIRLSKISDEELTHRLKIAWRMQAPKKMVAEFDGVTMPPKPKAARKKPKGK